MLNLQERFELFRSLIRSGWPKREAINSFNRKEYKKPLTVWNSVNGTKQNAFARTVRALSAISDDRNRVRGMARIIVNSMPKVTVSHDNPNSNVSYSRGKVGWKNHKKRTTIKFSRFVSRHCKLKFSDEDLERMQLLFQYEIDYKLVVVEGVEATKIYADIPELHSDYEIPGLSSCMTGSDSKYVEVHFNLNPSNLKLALLYNGNRLMARGKIWKNDDDTWFIDRVYVRKGIPGLTEHAASQCIISQFEHSDKFVSYYKVTIKLPTDEYMPYLDNADSYDRIGDKIYLSTGGDFVADTTDGSDKSQQYTCDECGESCNEDDCTTVEGNSLCQGCYDNYTENHTEIDGEWYSNDNVCWDEINDENILVDDSVELFDGRRTCSDGTSELSRHYYDRHSYALDDDTIKTWDGLTILESDSIEHNGETYHKDEELPAEVEESLVTV